MEKVTLGWVDGTQDLKVTARSGRLCVHARERVCVLIYEKTGAIHGASE